MTLIEGYLERLRKATSISELNDVVDEAANDDGLTNGEYEEVYTESLNIVHGWWEY